MLRSLDSFSMSDVDASAINVTVYAPGNSKVFKIAVLISRNKEQDKKELYTITSYLKSKGEEKKSG